MSSAAPRFGFFSRLSLQTKLFFALAIVGVGGVVSTGYVGYSAARLDLEAAIMRQMESIAQAKARQIEDYFATAHSEVTMLAMTRVAESATNAFKSAVRKLDGPTPDPREREAVIKLYQETFLPKLRGSSGIEPVLEDYLPIGAASYHLQCDFLVRNAQPAETRKLIDAADDDCEYNKAHREFHPLLRRFVESLGFADLMLVDPDTGRIIYSVMKKPDFGTSLFTGPYSKSSLSAAVQACKANRTEGESCLEDFRPYPASLGAPASFLTAPIFEEGSLIGILAIQLSDIEIDQIMTFDRNWARAGLGLTGETYLVGPDNALRSTSRFFLEDPEEYFKDLQKAGASSESLDAIRRHGTPVLQQVVRTKAVAAALAGIEGTDIVGGYRGVPTLAAYRPVTIPGVSWALVAKIDAAEAFAPIARLRLRLAMLGIGAVLIVLLAGGWLSRALLGPLERLVEGAQKYIAGDRKVAVPVTSGDETGRLCAVFNEMVGHINEKTEDIERKNHEIEDLLLNILPETIASRLRGGEDKIADKFADVTVLFADIVDFTVLSSKMPAHQVVEFLNDLFSRFDSAATDLGIEKIKTIGDAYMAVCGLPHACDNHAEQMLKMAIRMVHATREFSLERGIPLQLRIGVNSGPVVAGVIGLNKFIYDLWGDTVNLASRMESHGVPGTVQVTRSVYEKLKDRYPFESRGEIEIKGKGMLEVWTLKI